MHIVIVVNSINRGGAGRQACELANFFIHHGHKVSLIPVNGITVYDNYPLSAEVSLRFLDIAQEEDQANGTYKRLLNFFHMRRLLAEIRADVLFAFLPYGIMLSLFATLGKELPVVACERNYPPARIASDTNMLRRWMLHLFYQLVIPRADVITGQTEATMEWLQAIAPKTRIEVIPNALPNFILEHEGGGQKRSCKVVLAVGRLVPQKRMDVLIKAFVNASAIDDEWKLVLIGDGPESERLSKMVPQSFSEKVLFRGHENQLAKWYSCAEIFVLASEFEGFPNVLIEALSLNTACVAFDIKTGPKEILKNGVAGVLLPDSHHLERLAKALKELMENQLMRERFKEEALYVRTAYDQKNVLSSWVTLAEELAEK